MATVRVVYNLKLEMATLYNGLMNTIALLLYILYYYRTYVYIGHLPCYTYGVFLVLPTSLSWNSLGCFRQLKSALHLPLTIRSCTLQFLILNFIFLRAKRHKTTPR